MSELNGTKLVIEEEVQYIKYHCYCNVVLYNNSLQEDEDFQTMTVKEIEEQKRKEKVLQQKKVIDVIVCIDNPQYLYILTTRTISLW